MQILKMEIFEILLKRNHLIYIVIQSDLYCYDKMVIQPAPMSVNEHEITNEKKNKNFVAQMKTFEFSYRLIGPSDCHFHCLLNSIK